MNGSKNNNLLCIIVAKVTSTTILYGGCGLNLSMFANFSINISGYVVVTEYFFHPLGPSPFELPLMN